MARYHLNPETGVAGECKAQVGNCPFKNANGDEADHYPTIERTRRAYENLQEGSFNNSLRDERIKEYFPNGSDRKIDGGKYWQLQEEAETIYKNLTEDEQKAVDYYNSYRYYDLNETLWNNGELNESALDDAHFKSKAEVVENLDKIIKDSHFETPQIVYRGIKNYKLSENKEKSYENNYDVGSTFKSPGYMSATYDLDTARHFSGNDGVVFEILTKSGYNKGTTEVELLLERDQEWRVVGKDNFTNQYGVHMQVVQLVSISEYNNL